MSVKVDLAGLEGQLESHGFAYLMTVAPDLRAHAVAVRPVLSDGVLRVEGLGRGTRANLVARPEVSLVWPPSEEGGYSLIVDGRAEADGDGAAVTPAHAVLHRPAAPGATGRDGGCGSDCAPLAEAPERRAARSDDGPDAAER